MKYLRFLIFPLWYLAMSCATQTTPQGGPKDSIPPTVRNFIPRQNSTDYKGKEIVIEFTEDVVLNNAKEEIIIIPSPGSKTDFKLKGRTLFITPENPLRDSTTYNINFREGIKDITEGNVAKDRDTGEDLDLHLAFSTGPMIDTLSIAGSIKNARDENIPENITIALYTSDTFNIFEHTPDYFTKSNKQGKYQITNLKAGTYKMYAFDDKNKNLKAETRSEKFGFLATPVQLDSQVNNLEIAMVNIDTRPPKLTSIRNQSTVNIIRANKALTDYDLISNHKILSSFGATQSEVIAHYPAISEDSLKIQFRAIDSTEQVLDTLFYIKRDSSKKIQESFKVTSGEATYNLETNLFEYYINFNKPLKAITGDSIYLQYDSLTRLPLKLRSIKVDTMFNKLYIKEVYPLDSLPNPPALKIPAGYLISIDNDSSKAMSPTIRALEAPTTATLLLEIQTKEPHFIIEVLTSNNKVLQTAVDQKKITFQYLNPESLKIRAIIDKNGNGKWDTAIYPQNREPEKIVYYLNAEKKTETPLRANWEVGPLIFKF